MLSVLGLAGCAATAGATFGPTLGSLESPTTAPTLATQAATKTPAPSRLPTPFVVKITPIPNAPDSGITIEMTTNGFGFSLTNIDAPAGKIWHIHIVRTGGNFPPNNFTVASGPTTGEWIFHSTNLSLGEHTFDIPALPAGHYLFYCTIDPATMHGTVTVK